VKSPRRVRHNVLAHALGKSAGCYSSMTSIVQRCTRLKGLGSWFQRQTSHRNVTWRTDMALRWCQRKLRPRLGEEQLPPVPTQHPQRRKAPVLHGTRGPSHTQKQGPSPPASHIGCLSKGDTRPTNTKLRRISANKRTNGWQNELPTLSESGTST
jgi:hypothetical protein